MLPFRTPTRISSYKTFPWRVLPSRYHPVRTFLDLPERLEVPVGSDGSVSLDIFKPASSPQPNGIVIYLPRGPVPLTGDAYQEPESLQGLANNSNALTIRINYRLSSNGSEKYPLPIHDVSAGWNWILSNIAKLPQLHRVAPSRRRHVQHFALGVCGEFIGGSLAASLALTEGRLPPLIGIRAAYLGNPIADWTMMHAQYNNTGSDKNDGNRIREVSVSGDTVRHRTSRKRRKGGLASIPSWVKHADLPILPASKLLSLRHKLFASSSYPFDPFASPLLFFRTPASEEPSPQSEENDLVETLRALPLDEAVETGRELYSAYFNGANDINGSAVGHEIAKRNSLRRSHRRWPPLRSNIQLPQVHLRLGRESPLKDMGQDLANCINRSVFFYEQEKACDLKDITRAVVEETNDKLGAWDGMDIDRIGSWFRGQLEVANE